MTLSSWTIDTLKEYFEALLSGQQKAVDAAFSASEKAIEKAEASQTAYNLRSNEFRSALDDSNKLMSTTMVARHEAEARFLAVDETVDVLRNTVEEKIETIKKEIASLRESRSEIGGRGIGAHNFWVYLIGATTLLSIVINLLLNIKLIR